MSTSSSSSHHHKPHQQTWTRDGFLISTDPSLISIPALTSAFAQEWMYWAKPLAAEAMQAMVDKSLCFGLYTPTPMTPVADPGGEKSDSSDPIARIKTESERPPASRTNSTTTSLIGFARLITDTVTFAYLTDVYILPEWQGSGLGKWLVDCVQEVVEKMPYLRRSMLITGREGPAGGFYERRMRMEAIDPKGDLMVMSWVGPGWPGRGEEVVRYLTGRG
jgi:ribosomal protein S18 acetylase RimI-like enzyme